jgi:hypothetical protein
MIRTRSRSSPALRLAILAGIAIAFRHFLAPTYSVAGSWEGSLGDVKTLPTGLDQVSVDGLSFRGSGVNLSVSDGHLTGAWAKGPFSLSANDAHEWQFNFTGDDGSLVSHGTGVDKFDWKASKQHTVEGFGDVDVLMTSGKDFLVKVTPYLPEVAGVQFAGHARSDGDGLQGRLQALKQLEGDVDLEYTVENAAGDYGLANLAHLARVDLPLAGNKASLEVGYDGDAPTYNATYELEELPVLLDSKAVLGVDNDGIYGSLDASHGLIEGVDAGYKLRGRVDPLSNTSDPELAQSLRVSHSLGHVELAQGTDKPIEATAHIAHGPGKVDAHASYDLDSSASTYNVTITGDLAPYAAGQLDSAEVQVGLDSDGPYAMAAASRDLGFDDLVAKYSTSGRLDALEHALEVSNNWGHAKLMKSGSETPRLQLGYELEV